MQEIIVWIIAGLAAGYIIKKYYKTFTGKEKGCNCNCSGSADCGGKKNPPGSGDKCADRQS